MNAFTPPPVSRRFFLATGGALVVSFSLFPKLAAMAQEKAAELPGDLGKAPMLDSWIAIDANGAVTVFTGKAELGQGVKTAFIQCAAEELQIDPASITLITADTERTANEGYTAGSHSMQDSGTAILNAAAQVRGVLVELAATRFSLPVADLSAKNGTIVAKDGRSVAYKDLLTGQELHRPVKPTSPLSDPKTYTVIGKPMQRVDIPGKLTGAPSYVQDMRPKGMLHARVVRPPNYAARLTSLDTAATEKMPGVVKVVRDGSFIAVVAKGEFQAIEAMHVLSDSANWQQTDALPDPAKIFDLLKSLPTQDRLDLEKGTLGQPAVHRLNASYRRHYMMHTSIGPSCALALFEANKMTVWTHSQGVYPLRDSLAGMLKMPKEQVHCIHAEGSGCYGHNGADDVAADAALIARAMEGTPIRVQWMREQENGFEPYGPAMLTELSGGVGHDGKMTEFTFDVWSNTHSTRPGPPGNLLAARHLAEPFAEPAPTPLGLPEGGGDRNGIPLYSILNSRIIYHFIPHMPLRVSAMRALGAYHNVFSIESFMDEMAEAAGLDPVEFRLRNMEDARARDVITKAAQEFGWKPKPKGNRPDGNGCGFAFARYKNLGAYCAVAVNLEVEHETGEVRLGRIVTAVDSGQAVNHDGIRNQIEGAIVQSASWTLFEEVTWTPQGITSRDWSSYPMVRFPAIAESVTVHVIDRPGEKFLGTGEAGQGPTAAAIANAIFDATGQRLRELPLTAARIKAAVGV